MDGQTLVCCAPVEDSQAGGLPVVPTLRPSEVVRVPVPSILYLQAMAENGQGDLPKPRGHALPCGHVRYRQ